MSWVAAEGFERRPLVVVEDHLYHMTELLDRLGGSAPLYDQLTVVCLDRPGPDTSRSAAEWLAAYPGLQVIAATGDERQLQAGPQFRTLSPNAFTSAHALCTTIAGALRPGGLLLQDIQLETLTFIPADRWWESIYLANTVRGMFPDRPPACRFISNKRGYEATFGRELLDAGFDPREVIDKSDLDRTVVPMLRSFLDRAFPVLLDTTGPGRGRDAVRIGRGTGDREELEAELDLLLWADGDVYELSGRLVEVDAAEPGTPEAEAGASSSSKRSHGRSSRRIAFKPGSHEAATWRSLLRDRLAGGSGLAVVEVGRRLGPPDAGKPELTNVAARHLHILRSRLTDPAAIQTAEHAYRIAERLTVGVAQEVRAAAAKARPGAAAPTGG